MTRALFGTIATSGGESVIIGRHRLLAALTFSLCVPIATATPLQRLATVGDSLTDEYAEESYSYARSWTELLAGERNIELGPTANEAGQPGNTWGEPRRTGFEDNWARFGATTDEAITDGQHVGAAEGVNNRDVTHVVLFIGGNDFSPWSGAYSEIYDEVWTQSNIDDWIAGRIANYETLLNTIEPTGAKVLLANIIDFSPMPFIAQGGFADPNRRELVATALSQFSDEARLLAEQRGLIFIDALRLAQALFGTNLQPRATLVVGNIDIIIAASDSPSGANPEHAWVDDRVHPNTVIQGILANLFATALSVDGDVSITPFSEEEILSNAGLTYGGSDTLEAQIGLLGDYITDFSMDVDVVFSNGFE